MNDFDFKPIVCKNCGHEINYVRDGVSYQSPCRCQRMKERRDRIVKTVDLEFFNPDGTIKLMNAWNPPMFATPTEFPGFMKAQRAIVLKKLYEFAFKPLDDIRAMSRSVAGRINFFLRGPQGTGRGLIAANLKIAVAQGDLRATQRDDRAAARFEVFKDICGKAMALGKAGDEAEFDINLYYHEVDVMFVEGVRADTRLNFSGDAVRHKFSGAPTIDSLIASRRKGSMVITSHDFLGQIRETLGETFMDEMCSQRTMIGLLLSPAEADLLHGHLWKTYGEYRTLIGKLRNKEAAGEKKRLTDRAADKEDAALMREALLFGAAMEDHVPAGVKIVDMTRQLIEYKSLGRDAEEQFRRFVEDEVSGGRTFDEDKRLALGRAISSSQFLKDSIVDRERDELVKIVRLAINEERVRNTEAACEEMIREMSEI